MSIKNNSECVGGSRLINFCSSIKFNNGEPSNIVISGINRNRLISNTVKVIIGVGVVNGDSDCGGGGSIYDAVIDPGDGYGLWRIPVRCGEGYACWDGCFTGVIRCDRENNI